MHFTKHVARILLLSALTVFILTGAAASVEAPAGAVPAMRGSIVYKNTDYGFVFTLPKDWKGFSVVAQEWKGTFVADSTKPPLTGPELLIRNPAWTAANPTQDIPIMIFTPDEWGMVLREELAVSAAPIPPSVLGRNSKYVFALPARYNFAFLPGWEEVEKILQGKPLKGTESFR